MNFYKTLFLLFAFCFSNFGTTEQVGDSKLNAHPKSDQIIPIFQDGRGEVVFRDIYLGMAQSMILDKDTSVDKASMQDPENVGHPRILSSGNYETQGNSVIYLFSDVAPVLTGILILKKLDFMSEQRYVLTDIVAKFGEPSAYKMEFQRGEELVVLVWDKKNVNLAVSYSPVSSKIESSFTMLVRILSKDMDLDLKSLPKRSDGKSTIDLDLEKNYIEQLYKGATF